MIQNAIPDPGRDLARRVAQQTLSKRGDEYAEEVRRLLDAALELMQRHGTSARPRVSDIVAAAGLSNDAFYRHFPSKDALVTAILEDGAERLTSYLAHQVTKAAEPQAQLRAWVRGVLSQADPEIAATTLAVLWNGGSAAAGAAAGRHFASAPLAALLVAPYTALGAERPQLTAELVAHAVLGKLADYLWQRRQPTRAEIDGIVAFCVAAAAASVKGRARARSG